MSKFEDYILSILKVIFPGTLFQRELQVKKLFKDYHSGMDRYDFVSKKYKIIIECHGAQHRKLVAFGKEDIMDTVSKLAATQYRDFRKEEVATKNGWTYVIIWYDEITNKFDNDLEIIKAKIKDS